MATETVIIDVNIQQSDALARAKELNDRLIVLRDSQDKLRASGNQLGTTYKDNAQQIRQLESEVNAYIKLSKNEEGSINSLRAQAILLTNQYNALSKSERENTDVGKALTKQIAAINAEEQKASKAIGNFKTSIGNYGDALRGATQNLLPFGSETARAFAAVNSLAGAFKGAAGGAEVLQVALASTGIGAIVVVVASLVAYLKDLDAVTDTVEQKFAGLKASFSEFGRSVLTFDFKGLSDRIRGVGVVAEALESQNQDLQDRILAQSVKSADAQAEVQQKLTEAKNKALDPKERQRLLKEAEDIDAADLAQRQKNVEKEVELAQLSIANSGNLTKKQFADLKKRGVDTALELQNNLVSQGKVTDEQTKRLAEALKNRDAIQNEYTLRQDRRNNLSERISIQAQAAEQRRADALQKIAEDEIKSELNRSASMLTARQKEFADINADIDKRELLYRKYGVDTVNIERERQARLQTLATKFQQEDLQILEQTLRKTQLLQAQGGKNSFADPNASVAENTTALNTQFNVDDLDKQIEAYAARVAFGEQGLADQLQAFVDLRVAIQAAGDEKLKQLANDRAIAVTESADAANQSVYDGETRLMQQQVENHNARLRLNGELTESYQSLFGTISGLLDKNSAAGKVAFVLEKAFAIARIIINAEMEKSEIRLSYATQARQAALIPVVGPFLSGALIAAGEVLAAKVTAQEVISSAAVAATTVGAFATGGFVTGPGSGTSDSIPARLSNGEVVINARSAAMFKPLLSDMNVAGGGVPFATGGIAGSYVPNLSQQIDSDNAISRSIQSQLRGIKIYTAIEDIRTADKQFSNLEANGNF